MNRTDPNRPEYPRPPQWLDRLLTRLVAPHLREEVLGDLHERYHLRAQRLGERQARRAYGREVLAYLRPAFLQRQSSEDVQPFFLSPDMLRNYFKIAWRNIVTNKVYSALNIFGLSISLGVGILLLWWVRDEFRFDRFHPNADHIYRMNGAIGTGSSQQWLAGVPAPVAAYAKRRIPGVEEAVRVQQAYNVSPLKVLETAQTEESVAYVDPAFFTMFDFEWVQGSRQRPFSDNQSVVLTESAARKYFGTADPMGRAIESVRQKRTYVVSGIIRDFPDHSSLNFNVLLPYAVLLKNFGGNGEWKQMEEDWGNWVAQTYLRLSPGTSPERVASLLTQFHHQGNRHDQQSFYRPQRLADVHLVQPDGSAPGRQQVLTLLVVALVLLSIGCINYVNLATARAAQRAREVSVRKMIGAARGQLLAQFLAESLVLFGLALVLAIGLIKLLEPTYRELTGKTQSFSLVDPQVWLLIGGALGFTLLLAGLYPAVVLSSFDPLRVLRGGPSAARGGRGTFRQALVVTQFVFSTALIAGTLVIGQQMRYVRERNLGYDRANTFTFRMADMREHYPAVRNELLRIPGVRAVSSAGANLLDMGNTTGDTDWDGKGKDQMFIVAPMGIDKDFIPSFKIPLVAGRNFSGSPADSIHLILNETAVRQAGIRNPVGKRFKLWDTDCIIIGITKDFHFASLHERIQPAAFYHNPDASLIYIKTTGEAAPKALAAAERLWKQYNPEYPFTYRFLDETYNQMYQSEQRTGRLFNFFAGVAILISCLGLFGLAAFTAQQRTKEIGVRKVLGASVTSIVALLSKDFLKLVLIAIVIASPVAWYAMNRWLQDFAYKIDIEWWVFALAGVLAVSIALLTVSFQSIKAALMNPVKSLRSE